MPALPNVSNVIRWVLSGQYGDTSWAHVMHLRYDGDPPTTSELNDANDACFASYIGTLLPNWSVNVNLSDSEMTDIDSDTGAVSIISGETHAGGNNSTNLTANVSCCISWKIARHYRGGHPRTYSPGLGTSSLTDFNTFTTAFVGAVQSDAEAFIGLLESAFIPALWADLELVCVHYRQNNAPLTVPLVDKITGAAVDRRVDTQRRRLGK